MYVIYQAEYFSHSNYKIMKWGKKKPKIAWANAILKMSNHHYDIKSEKRDVFLSRIIRVGKIGKQFLFSDISERNNDYSDTLDFRRG